MSLRSIFWDGKRKRLRMVWRALAALLLGILVLALLSRTFGLLTGLVMGLLGPDSAAWSALLRSLGIASAAFLSSSPFFLLVQAILMTVATLITLWLAARFLDRRPFADYGLHLGKDWWIDLGFGLALGAMLMTGIFVLLWAIGWAQVIGLAQTKVPFVSSAVAEVASLVGFIGVGIYEELIARGYLLQNLSEGLCWGPITPGAAVALAWLLSSVLFGLAHVTNPNATVISTANLMVAGLLLGTGYVLTGELAIPIGLHIAWNFFQGPVFGFPVSGLQPAVALLVTAETGPDLWTGGKFGPEAGLVDILASLLGGLMIFLWVRARYGVSRQSPLS